MRPPAPFPFNHVFRAGGTSVSADQVAELKEALVTAVREAAADPGDRASSVNLSEVTATRWEGIAQRVGLASTLHDSSVPVSTRTIDAFGWDVSHESAQADRYIPYLRKIVRFPGGRDLEWIRADGERTLLSVSSERPLVNLQGTCDAAIVTRLARRSLDFSAGIVAVFELKKVVESRHLFQAKAQVLAANIRCPDYRPFGVLTDLNDYWSVFYLVGSTICCVSPESREAAVAFIEHLLLTRAGGDNGGHAGSGPGPGGGGGAGSSGGGTDPPDGGGGAGPGTAEGAPGGQISPGAEVPASKRNRFSGGVRVGAYAGGRAPKAALAASQHGDDVANLEDLEGFLPQEECQQAHSQMLSQKLRLGLAELAKQAAYACAG